MGFWNGPPRTFEGIPSLTSNFAYLSDSAGRRRFPETPDKFTVSPTGRGLAEEEAAAPLVRELCVSDRA